jgi:hypothetical protein
MFSVKGEGYVLGIYIMFNFKIFVLLYGRGLMLMLS